MLPSTSTDARYTTTNKTEFLKELYNKEELYVDYTGRREAFFPVTLFVPCSYAYAPRSQAAPVPKFTFKPHAESGIEVVRVSDKSCAHPTPG